MAQRRVTLADVAAAAGMSKSAVSMVLNDLPGARISASSAARVRQAAEQLGYRPNPAAQSLRIGKTRTIGFISDLVTVTRYATGMTHGALQTARAHGHTVLMAETEGAPGRLEECVAQMLHRRVDGILIGLMAARLIDVPAVPDDVPVVMVNGHSSSDHPSVLPAEYEAGLATASLLVEAGHRRIGIIGPLPNMDDPRHTVTIGARFRGIADGLAEAGIDPVTTVVPHWDPHVGYEATLDLLPRHPDLTAVIASTDGVAMGVYQAAHKLGLDIPGDLSVASFDDEELAGYLRPELTTMRLPYVEMARVATEMVLGEREPAHELVPMPGVVRGSIRAR